MMAATTTPTRTFGVIGNPGGGANPLGRRPSRERWRRRHGSGVSVRACRRDQHPHHGAGVLALVFLLVQQVSGTVEDRLTGGGQFGRHRTAPK
jgi:hypothetical protein